MRTWAWAEMDYGQGGGWSWGDEGVCAWTGELSRARIFLSVFFLLLGVCGLSETKPLVGVLLLHIDYEGQGRDDYLARGKLGRWREDRGGYSLIPRIK